MGENVERVPYNCRCGREVTLQDLGFFVPETAYDPRNLSHVVRWLFGV